jgi:hypothetical protein
MEKIIGTSKSYPEEHLLTARKMRDKTKEVISAQETSNAINEGRP